LLYKKTCQKSRLKEEITRQKREMGRPNITLNLFYIYILKKLNNPKKKLKLYNLRKIQECQEISR